LDHKTFPEVTENGLVTLIGNILKTLYVT